MISTLKYLYVQKVNIMKLEIKNGKSFWRLSEHEQEVLKPYGTSRTSLYFKTRNMLPLHSKEGFTLYHFYNRGPVYSDYIIIEDSALNLVTPELDRIPTIEVSLDNYTLNIRRWLTEEDRVPDIAKQIVKEYCLNNQTTNTLPIPIKYLKLYIAVLDEVNDEMVPTLVAHSMLGAHLWLEPIDIPITSDCTTIVEERGLYLQWLHESFRKCVVRVNRKEFEKISKLPLTYLGHENTTLDGEKSCAVVYPIWSNEVPNVLKFSKLWKPTHV